MTVLIVFKERIYKIWKQFTTSRSSEDRPAQLCSKNEYTKSESNSQPILSVVVLEMYCVQRTNIQNLKAIHNYHHFLSQPDRLCSKNEYTKSESNSQRVPLAHYLLHIVFKERIYKIWKQFTTGSITMSIFRPFQLLGFFNSINNRKISIDKSCNY